VSGEALLLVAAGPGASAYRIDDGSRLFHASSEDLFGRLAAGSLAGEAVVVAPTARGPLRLWRLADGGRIAEWRPREVDLVDALALVELRSGQSVVVAGSRVVWPADGGGERVGAVEVWAIDGPEPRLVRTLEGPTGPAPGSREAGVTKIVRIAPVTYRGTPMLVVVGWDGSIRLSDPETGTAVLDVPGGWGPVSDLAAATTSAGLALVLSGDGIVRVVHVAGDGSWTGATLPVGHGKGFTPVAAGEIAGERVCASVGADHRVRIWRLSDAALLAEAPVALEGDAVTGLAVTTSGGEPVVVTGDSRGTVRVWPYRALAEAAEARGSAGHIEAVHALRAPGQCRLVTRERSGKVALWNASDGSRLRPAWLAGEEPVRLAAGMLGDRPVVALLDRSGVLRASFADDGAPCGRPIRLAGVSLDLPIGFCAWRGRPHAAAVLHWREMALYDLESGDLVGVAPVGANEWSSRFMSPEKPVVPPWSFVLVPSEWGPLAVTFGYPDCFEAWPLTSEAQTAGSDRGLAETAVTVAPGLQFLVERPLATGTVRAAAACTAGDRPLVAAWRYGDAVLRLYDVTERQPVGEPLPASDLGAIACAEDRGEVLVAAGTPRGEIRLWRGAELRLTVHTNCALHGLALLGTDGLAIAASEGLMVLRLSEHG
jgi:WD40 repeat protein